MQVQVAKRLGGAPPTRFDGDIWHHFPQGGKLGAMTDVTRILSRIELGDPTAADQLLPRVNIELRRLVAARLTDDKPGRTVTAAVSAFESTGEEDLAKAVRFREAGLKLARGRFSTVGNSLLHQSRKPSLKE